MTRFRIYKGRALFGIGSITMGTLMRWCTLFMLGTMATTGIASCDQPMQALEAVIPWFYIAIGTWLLASSIIRMEKKDTHERRSSSATR